MEYHTIKTNIVPVGLGYRIHRLLHCRGVKFTKRLACYDTKVYDCDALKMLVLWGMQSTPSFPSFPSPLWPEVVAPDRVLSIG